jgi:hypothetical protein
VAKTLTTAKMMGIVAAEGWCVTVSHCGRHFHCTVWSACRTARVDAFHYSHGGALHRALSRALHGQWQQEGAPEPQERDRQPGLARPSPELLATVMGTATEAVA